MRSVGRSAIVVGAGAFGVPAALELRARGWNVTLVDRGPVPHPEASSTDISKAVRMDYGTDELYTELAERSIVIWRAWNERWREPIFHEVGFLLLSPEPLRAGTFEGDSFEMLGRRGCRLERVRPEELERRFPAWNAAAYADGYFNPRGGWAASGRAVALLAAEARQAGVVVRENVALARLHETDARVSGVVTAAGEVLSADVTVVAAGAWTPALLPQLAGTMWATGQPVFHFRPADPEPFRGERFPVWAADIQGSGWYGFPANADGIVKVANHGTGLAMHADDPKVVPEKCEPKFREFVRTTFAGLAEAPIVNRRLCLYCDTWDGNFWIDRDPERDGLCVATGGSGHAFKFMPLLGEFVADAVEGKPTPSARRFAFRQREGRVWEQARHHPE